MGDADRRPSMHANLDDIPLPPPANDQPARLGDWTMRPIGDAQLRNEQLRQFYHDGHSGYNAPEAPWLHNQSASNRQIEHENFDPRLHDDFSEDDSTLNRYQSAEDLHRLYPQLDTSDNRDQEGSAADEEFRYWAANSPIARNLHRVMSDGSFAQPQDTNDDHGAHWNGALPTSPLGQQRAEQTVQNVPHSQTGRYAAQNQLHPAGSMRFEQERSQSNIVPPDTSREVLTKLDSILDVVQNLHTRVRQLEGMDKQATVTEIPNHLQPRQVNPVHRQRLQTVLQNALPKRVQFQDHPSRPSAPPLTSSEESVDQTSSPQGSDHRAIGDPQRSQASERVHYANFPTRGEHSAERIPDTYQRPQMEILPPDNMLRERAADGNYDLRHTPPNDSSAAFCDVASRHTGRRSDYTREPIAGVNGTNETKLTELLLRGTVSSQIQNLSGLQGISTTKDWFRQFEGLTDGWSDAQRMNLLGLKAVQSARLSFEAYENEAITPVYWEAKRAILHTVSAEDSRPISAWNYLKHLQQKPFQSVADFGRHVKFTVSKALGDSLSAVQLEGFCKNYFVDGLRDLGIRRALAGQQERARYTDLVREGALIERSCPTELPPGQPDGNSNHQGAITRDGNYRNNIYGSRPNNYQGNADYNTRNSQQGYTQHYQNQNQNQGQVYQANNFGPPKGSFNKAATHNNTYQKPQTSNWTPKTTWQGNSYQNQQTSNSLQPRQVSGANTVPSGQNFQNPRRSDGPGAGSTGQARQ